jgi:hypothetical protein
LVNHNKRANKHLPLKLLLLSGEETVVETKAIKLLQVQQTVKQTDRLITVGSIIIT